MVKLMAPLSPVGFVWVGAGLGLRLMLTKTSKHKCFILTNRHDKCKQKLKYSLCPKQAWINENLPNAVKFGLHKDILIQLRVIVQDNDNKNSLFLISKMK